ncbi:MAG TPA: outer membrane beta-barrel protein [Cellvibrio sp.]|nr:outer membrane beta-barrel protein [Cellvibrio sp.]
MSKRLALLISALSLASVGVQAQETKTEEPVDFHVSGQAVYTKVKASGESFSPSLFQLKADIEFNFDNLRGIGLQGMVGMPMSDDKANGMTLELTQQSGIYVTLTDPDTKPDDLKVSILLGYASTEIETSLPSLTTGQNKDTFSDFSYGFTLQDQIVAGEPFYWTLDVLRYYKDDDLRVDGLGLGVTYAF